MLWGGDLCAGEGCSGELYALLCWICCLAAVQARRRPTRRGGVVAGRGPARPVAYAAWMPVLLAAMLLGCLCHLASMLHGCVCEQGRARWLLSQASLNVQQGPAQPGQATRTACLSDQPLFHSSLDFSHVCRTWEMSRHPLT